MKSISNQTEKKGDIRTLPVVKNFRKVMEERNLSSMTNELYEFFHLYCGFIAHYNINGFRETYAAPRDFADVFIRHFDKSHCYFCGNYACHDEPYQNTGFTKAEIKREFFNVVDKHKAAISMWVDGLEKQSRYAAFQALKNEFEEEEQQIHLDCELCGEHIDIKIKPNGREKQAMGNLCCLFCGQPIHISQPRGEHHEERFVA